MYLNTETLWQNEEQIELSDVELQMVQGGHGASHRCTYGNYSGGNDCGGSNSDFTYNYGSNCGNYAANSNSACGNYAGAYFTNYNDGSNCDGSQGTFVIMQVLPASSCSNSYYNTCG